MRFEGRRLATALLGLATACTAAAPAPDRTATGPASSAPTAPMAAAAPPLRALVAGRAHACVLLRDGTARCWGSNELGQLGDGTRTTRSFPVMVKGLAGASKLFAWRDSTCALSDAGEAWCWGATPWREPLDSSRGRGLATTPVEVPSPEPLRSLAWDAKTLCTVDVRGGVRCATVGRSHELRLTKPAEHVAVGEALACAAGRDLEAECFDATDPASEAIPLGLEARGGLAVFGVRVCALDHQRVECLQPVTRFWKRQPLRSRFAPPVPTGDVEALLPTGHVVMKDGVVAQLRYVATMPGFEASRVTAWKQLGEGARSMAFGEDFACALHDAEVRCFGDNARGQLGRGHRDASLDAAAVEHALGDVVASPPASANARAAASKDRPEKLLKYVHVWANARVFSAPSPDAARGRLADWDDSLRYDPYDGRHIMKVLGRQGDFIEVVSPDLDEVEARCAPPLVEAVELRAFVHVDDLAPLLPEKKKVSFEDGSSLDLAAGNPLYIEADGKVSADVFGTRLGILGVADAAWSAKALGKAPRATREGVHTEGTTLRLGPHVVRVEDFGVATVIQGKEEPKTVSAGACAVTVTAGIVQPTRGRDAAPEAEIVPKGSSWIEAGATAQFEDGTSAGRLRERLIAMREPVSHGARACVERALGSITLCFEPARVAR